MKVFLSWSGDVSLQVAVVLRDWLPSVIQAITPYVSSEDIDKGARWSTDIAKELEESSFGVLCVTQENMEAPWLNFEAGALSKTMEKAYVSPFLFNVRRAELKGPILQFQSTLYSKEDVKKLMLTLNSACGTDRLDETRLNEAFEIWWPELKKSLDLIKAKIGSETSDEVTADVEYPHLMQDNVLEEILELVRGQQRLLTSPEDLLPKEYLRLALEEKSEKSEVKRMSVSVKRSLLRNFERFLNDAKLHINQSVEEGQTQAECKRIIEGVIAPIAYLVDSPELL